jgi:hypothetical protein
VGRPLPVPHIVVTVIVFFVRGRLVPRLELGDEVGGDLEPSSGGKGGGVVVEVAKVGHVHAIGGAAAGASRPPGGAAAVPPTPARQQLEGLVRDRGHRERRVDLDRGVVRVLHQVVDLAAVDPDDPQQQVAAEAERERDDGVGDVVDGLRDVEREDLRPAEPLLVMGREPAGA